MLAATFSTTAPARALSCGPCPAATTDYLNLRSAPNLNSTVLLVIPPWTEVAYDASTGPVNGYYQVTYAGATGYAHGLYLLRFPAFATPTDWLNLRSEPNLDSAVLQVMAPGSNVEVLGLGKNGFYSVRWEQRLIGFASSDFLSLDHGAGFADGDTVVVRTDALNVRERGGLDRDPGHDLLRSRSDGHGRTGRARRLLMVSDRRSEPGERLGGRRIPGPKLTQTTTLKRVQAAARTLARTSSASSAVGAST